MQQVAPGWYADPYDPSLERVWDGSAWTVETRVAAAARGLTATPPAVWGGASAALEKPESDSASLVAPIARRGEMVSPARWSRWRWVVVPAAALLFVSGFAAGYAMHGSSRVTVLRSPVAAASTTEPANVDVPGPTAPAGIDTAGLVAQQNLTLAANIVRDFMRTRPGTALTQHDLGDYNPAFTFDIGGVPVGESTLGQAVISTAIDHLPGAPRRAVLALPGKSACYYVLVSEGTANEYGVARGADAASHCFASEPPGGVPQVRPETKWASRWPEPTS